MNKRKDLINELLENGLFKFISEKINDDLRYISSIDFKYEFNKICKDGLLFKNLIIVPLYRSHIKFKFDLKKFVDSFIENNEINNLKFTKKHYFNGDKVLYKTSKKLYQSIFTETNFEQIIEFNS